MTVMNLKIQTNYTIMTTFILPHQRFAGLRMGLQEESMPELAAHWQECCNQLQDFVCLLQTKKDLKNQHHECFISFKNINYFGF